MRMLPLVASFLRYLFVCLAPVRVCVCVLRRSVVVVDAERRELTRGVEVCRGSISRGWWRGGGLCLWMG